MSELTYADLEARLTSREIQLKHQTDMSQMLHFEVRGCERRIEELEGERRRMAADLSIQQYERKQAEAVRAILHEFYDHREGACEDEYGRCETCESVRDLVRGVEGMLAELRRMQRLLEAHEQIANRKRVLSAHGAEQEPEERLADLRFMLENALKTLGQVEKEVIWHG